jgi:hypothetical protein
MIGKMLGHYQITKKLGAGGMGVVYKAHDTHLDRSAALKVLPPGSGADAGRKQRFVQEARAASAFNHPNIVHMDNQPRAMAIDLGHRDLGTDVRTRTFAVFVVQFLRTRNGQRRQSPYAPSSITCIPVSRCPREWSPRWSGSVCRREADHIGARLEHAAGAAPAAAAAAGNERYTTSSCATTTAATTALRRRSLGRLGARCPPRASLRLPRSRSGSTAAVSSVGGGASRCISHWIRFMPARALVLMVRTTRLF